MEQRGDGRVISTLILSLCFLFSLFFLSAFPVSAATSFELTPLTLYEGTSHIFNFTITTSHLSKPIDEINLSAIALNSLIVTNDSQFNQGWDAVLGTSSILWKNNSIPKGSFVIYTYLQFSAKLPVVSADKREQWQISTVDNKGVVTINTLNVTIQNDATPPVLSNTYPAANGFLRSASNVVSAQAADPESGVASVGFNVSACGGNTTTTTLLGKSPDTPDNYSASADFSSFTEGTPVCFSFSSSSNGGEMAVAGGNFTIDNTPPAVTAVSPADNTFIAAAPNLSFFANDSISPSVSCTVLLNGAAIANITPNQSQLATISTASANASDGSYPWSVSCTDLAGNTGASAVRTVKVDTAPPTISLNAVPLIIRGRQNTVSGTIADFSGVSLVSSHATLNATANQTVPVSSDGSSYTFTLAPESTTELGQYSLIVHAEDGVGHGTTATVAYNVTYNYAVTLNEVSAAPGADATLIGTVRMDNASLVKETSISLALPNGTSVLVLLNNQTGGFSYTISAPAATGTYDIAARVSSENGITYNGTSLLIVTASPPSSEPGSGRGTRRSGDSSPGASPGAPSAGSPGVAAGTGAVSGISAASSASAPASASPSSSPSSASASAPASSDGATGIGRAGGFITAALLKYSKLIWTIIVVALVIGVLVYISRGPEGAVTVRRSDSSGSSVPSSASSVSSSSFSSSSTSPSVFSPSFQQPIRESTTRHDLDLDEYLRSRLGK